MKMHKFWMVASLTNIFLLSTIFSFAQVKTGAERTSVYFPLIKHKTIGIVANCASVIKGINIVDTLVKSRMEVKTIFNPEHGFRKFEDAGQIINNSFDSVTGIKIVSLYGKKKKPEKNDLKNLDIVVFDLQDVGVRFFTYLSTLDLVMEACAENNVPLILLDRPNPNGFYIDGPVADSAHFSFIGMHPVPVVYGMTIGEYAKMINEEGWLNKGIKCKLTVIPLENYSHGSRYLPSVKPSPNLPTINSIYLYPSLCLFEGTVISVGRGTKTPFEIIGHPELKGFSFSFTPQSIKGMSLNPPFRDQLCLGLDLSNFYQTHPKIVGRLNLAWLLMAFKDLNSSPAFFNDNFDRLAGTAGLRDQILQNIPESEIRKSWQPGLEKFREIRKKYLLYPD